MIIKVKKGQNPYACIDKVPINDKRLTWKARGVLLYLLSKPDDWRVIIADLINQSPQGESAVRSAIRELRKAGYIRREVVREKGKIVGGTYTVYERPIGTVDKPDVENLNLEKPNLENQGRLSNEEAVSNKQETKKTRSGKPTAPRKQVKYPKEWYKEALDAYQEIRGITLSGPEFSPLQQTLKTIFMAGHKPADAIGLMHALEDSEEEWTCNWTLRTVKMKLPLWKAGKLTLQDEQARIREYDRRILAGEKV